MTLSCEHGHESPNFSEILKCNSYFSRQKHLPRGATVWVISNVMFCITVTQWSCRLASNVLATWRKGGGGGGGGKHTASVIASCSSSCKVLEKITVILPPFQFLPYPELMPFRLTPQFTNLLLPHKEEGGVRSSGELRSCMVYTLRALRNSRQLLLNLMDVFVKEPSLDWKVRGYWKVWGLYLEGGGGH